MRLHEILKEETVQIGDHFDLELDDLVIETVVVDLTEDGVVIEADDTTLSYLSLDEGDKPRLASFNDRPREPNERWGLFRNGRVIKAFWGKDAAENAKKRTPGFHDTEIKQIDEAKYQGREVPLGKPMAGDVKKKKVYVRKPDGKVVKVNFGDKKMRIKKSNPKRRKSFRARHNCKNPGPRWKARYWSCRAW